MEFSGGASGARHPRRAGTTLYSSSNYMDILPIFIWSMAALPAFAWLEARIGVWALSAPIAPVIWRRMKLFRR